MTLGVAVLPSAAAAAKASQSLPLARLTSARAAGPAALAAGILVIRYRGSDAARYDYSRQLSGSIARGPYLIMYTAGYADSLPASAADAGPVLRPGDDQPGRGRRSVGGAHAGGRARQPALPGDPRMLRPGADRGRRGSRGRGRARLRRGAGRGCPAPRPAADTIRVDQQWVLTMMNVPAAWPLTQRRRGHRRGDRQRGRIPDVSDLAGSVINGPDYTWGVCTGRASPDWGVHGTWMASLIAGHGHAGDSGVIGVAPGSRNPVRPGDPGPGRPALRPVRGPP